MGVSGSDMRPAEQPAADSLLSALKTLSEADRPKHEHVLEYWLWIRGDREFPPLHDLDTLQISDAGPCSALLELIGGGEDAEIRHLGETLKAGEAVERIIDAPHPSILSSIAKKLSIVAISRNFLAFEDEFPAADGITRCWVTLLPFSSAGPWVDYVYAFVTQETMPAEAAVETSPDEIEPLELVESEVADSAAAPIEETESSEDPMTDQPDPTEANVETDSGCSEQLHSPPNPDSFYGAQTVKAATPRPPVVSAEAKPEAPAADAPAGALQTKLDEVRAKADEARTAKLKSNAALYEGLSAAYDFALDAEDSAEEYLKLVEAQGLKIQLRSPMLPVMKLAFDGMCDDSTIARLEAVLAWALEQELPRGTLAGRIEEAGGISRILDGEAAAA